MSHYAADTLRFPHGVAPGGTGRRRAPSVEEAASMTRPQPQYLTVTQAATVLGTSRQRVWRLLRDGRLTAYPSDLDKRQRLIRASDLAKLRRATTDPVAPSGGAR